MLTGKILEENGMLNLACYLTGNFPDGAIPCAQDGGKLLGFEWATPTSNNGVSVTGFNFSKATNSTPPAPDAFKVILVQDNKYTGSYSRFLVPNAYTLGDFVTACCAGCTPIAAVTIPKAIISPVFTETAAMVCPSPTKRSVFPLLAGGSNYVMNGYCVDANGVPVALSPTSVTAATAPLLADAAETAWGTALGTGVFTFENDVLTVTYTDCLGFAADITRTP